MKFGWKKEQNSIDNLMFGTVSNSFVSLNNLSDQYILKEYTPISDQLNLSSCVGNAVCDALECLLGQNGKVIQLSRLFVYWNARVYTRDTDKDDGCYIKNAFDSLQTLGCCSEDLWEYNENKVFLQPNLFSYKQANDNKINNFYRIDDNNRLNEIEMALRSNHPVVFGTAIPQTFIEYRNQSHVIWEPQIKNVGNHAMIITGIRWKNSKREFLIRNSWGNSFGENGHCWFSENYINSSLSDDFWVPTLMDSLL